MKIEEDITSNGVRILVTPDLEFKINSACEARMRRAVSAQGIVIGVDAGCDGTWDTVQSSHFGHLISQQDPNRIAAISLLNATLAKNGIYAIKSP